MYISLSHFIVLILIIHVLWYDTRQENYYFITKVIDKITKVKSKCCQGEGLNLCPLKTSAFPKLKIVKVLPPWPLATMRHSKRRVIKGMSFKTVKVTSTLRIWLWDVVILQKKCLSEAKQIYTRQFIIVLVLSFRQVWFCFRMRFFHNYLEMPLYNAKKFQITNF